MGSACKGLWHVFGSTGDLRMPGEDLPCSTPGLKLTEHQMKPKGSSWVAVNLSSSYNMVI